METKTIDISEAQSKLAELLKLVASGEEVILTDGSKPLARKIPVTSDMVIKQNLGKLSLTTPIKDIVEGQIRENGLEVLPVTLEHSLALDQLPAFHKDPFD